MNGLVAQKLRGIIQENGRALVRDPKRCEAIMADELADFASSARVLRMSLRCGIPAALADGARTEMEIAGFVHSLQQQGVSELKAREAIETWTAALGTAPSAVVQPPAAKPSEPVRPQEAPKPKVDKADLFREPGNLKPIESLGSEPWRWVVAILLIALGAGATAGGGWLLGGVLALVGFCVSPWR